MYSIPPGGFRHPYPALAMNASMSRWVLAGMRVPPWVSQSWQRVFGHLLEADADSALQQRQQWVLLGRPCSAWAQTSPRGLWWPPQPKIPPGGCGWSPWVGKK